MSDWEKLDADNNDNNNNNNNNNNNQNKKIHKINVKNMEIINHRFKDNNIKNFECLIKNIGWVECSKITKNREVTKKICDYIKKELKKDEEEIKEMVCFFVVFMWV